LQFCNSSGGKLAEIMSVDETEDINLFLNEVDKNGMGLYWIGLTDQKFERQFLWSSTNEVPEYTNWRNGEPNGNPRSKEDCVHLVHYSD
jgi:hypothetical protein